MAASDDADPHAAHHVLIVDDYDDTRDALAAVLGAHGWDVAVAWSVEDAMRHFRAGLRPCVVLLDLRMPGVDGWALWERMRADPALSGIAVVLCSGDEEQQARADAEGIREFVKKPVDPDELLRVVAQHCHRRQQA